jgi:hypothetical protein
MSVFITLYAYIKKKEKVQFICKTRTNSIHNTRSQNLIAITNVIFFFYTDFAEYHFSITIYNLQCCRANSHWFSNLHI